MKMSRIVNECFLRCVNNSNKKIVLPHGKTVYLGRSEDTMITDTTVSRKQIAATANYNSLSVAIETLGINYSGCNGYALRKGGTYNLKHGDRLELRIGFYEYEIIFEPTPDNKIDESEEPSKKKAKTSYSIFDLKNGSPSLNDKNGFDDKGEWESIDNGELLIYTCAQVTSKEKIAAFDLDGTLIKTKSEARFAKNADDWVLNFPEISQKLKELYQDNYKVVIFTNQGGVKTEKNKVSEFKKKTENVIKHIKVPVQLFAATGKSIYRKPAPGMWRSLCKEKNNGIEIDIQNSFYVGDAAGREKNWAPKKNKDHSISDRLFALNLGLKFYTPEEYFLGARSVPYVMPKFDPRTLSSSSILSLLSKKQEVIVMVGSPGSGKSHYCKKHIVNDGYVYVNRDTVGSWQGCVKQLETSVQQKQSVVIDNTNPDKTTRKRYIDVAKKFNVPCRCFVMTTNFEQCKHNNKFREFTDKSHIYVGDVILNTFKKNFEEPTLAEGFQEIVKVDFIPNFNNLEDENLYKMFLL